MDKTYGFRERVVATKLRDFARGLTRSGTKRSLPLINTTSIAELIRFHNTSDEQCPGGAVMLTKSEEDDDAEGLVSSVIKPTKEFKPYSYLVNIADPDTSIEADDFGWAVRLESAGWLLADDSSPTEIATGDLWGPKDNEWKVFPGLPGFMGTGHSFTDTNTNSFFVRGVQQVRSERVQCWESDGQIEGHLVAPNSDMLLPGRIARYNGATDKFGTTPDCWILFEDYFSVDSADTTKAAIGVHGRFYEAYPGGYFEHSSDTRALYLCSAGQQVFLAKTTADAPKGNVAKPFKLYNKDQTDSTITRNALPLGSIIKADKWATVKRFDDGEWYAGCWE